METLLVWIPSSNLLKSQEFKVCDVAKIVEHAATKMGSVTSPYPG
jgi:hypothetical protein